MHLFLCGAGFHEFQELMPIGINSIDVGVNLDYFYKGTLFDSEPIRLLSDMDSTKD